MEPYILCVTEFLTLDDAVLLNEVCCIARAFPRCTGICIQKPKWKYNLCIIQNPKWNTATFLFQLHKNYHTNWKYELCKLCEHLSFSIAALCACVENWPKTFHNYYYSSWVGLGTCCPRTFQISCFEVTSGEYGHWTGTTNVTHLLYF